MQNSHRDHPSHLPCLQCHPQAYIRMVQHMIERCLLLHLSRDDCVKALSRHANIPHAVTLTGSCIINYLHNAAISANTGFTINAVWRELLKENKRFFLDYFQGVPPLASLWKSSVRQD